jgi:putative DNA primase/helicase
MSDALQLFAELLARAGRRVVWNEDRRGFRFQCPCHDDRTPSASARIGDRVPVLASCQVCGPSADLPRMLEELGATETERATILGRKPSRAPRGEQPERVYEYRAEDGSVLFRVVRRSGKRFHQQKPNGRGGWVNDVKGVRIVPYRLPEVLAAMARGETIYLVEGEKDVETLAGLGLAATCNPGGAGKWRCEYAALLKRAPAVVSFADHDRPGERHAEDVARSFHAEGVTELRVVGFPELAKGGDVSDWLRLPAQIALERESRCAALLAYVESAPLWRPSAEDAPTSGESAPPTAVLPELSAADGRLSEIGNARLLVVHAAGRLRYCEAFGWLAYDGAIWRPDEAAARALCQQSMLTLYQRARGLADGAERKAMVRWAERYAQSQAGVTHTLLLARDHPEFRTLVHELDAHRDLIVFPNGTLEPDGTFRENRPDDLVTQAAGVPYDSGARCPTWDRFVSEIMLGREDLVQFLHRALGYSASGRTEQQCFFVLWGPGWNGKSVLLTIVRHVLGDYARGANRAAFVGGRYEDPRRALAALYGARFASFAETAKGMSLDEGLIKSATGGDPVVAAALYQREFTYTPTWKLWLATNHKPAIRDTTPSIWGRIRLVPFEASFPPGSPQRDEKLLEKLLAEGPGIAQRLVDGWLQYCNGIGLPTPDAVNAATESYRLEEDRLAPFLAEYCDVGPGLRCASSVLYGAYQRWAERDGLKKPLTQTAFGRELAERGFPAQREHTGERRVMRFGLDTRGMP